MMRFFYTKILLKYCRTKISGAKFLQEFGVLEPVQDGSDAVMERIGLLEDMRWEREQQDMLATLIADAPPTPIAMDEVKTSSPFFN